LEKRSKKGKIMKYPVITEQELQAIFSEKRIVVNNNSIFSSLIGKKIYSVFINATENVIYFDCGPDMFIGYTALGDCCSESWIADIFHFSNLCEKVLAVEEIPLDSYNVEDNRGRQEYDQVYGYRFITEQGQAILSFRNSSNGFYGGWLEPLKDALLLSSDFKKIQADENDVWQSNN
jgi:hypothetical protein